MKAFPEDKIPAVQYAALVADLVMKTKSTLKQLNQGDSDFVYLRMRTKQDTEMIVTDYIVPSSGNEYILVCLQQCKFSKEEELAAEVWMWCHVSVVIFLIEDDWLMIVIITNKRIQHKSLCSRVSLCCDI